MNDENTSFAQRSRKKIHFGHKDMDDYLSWMLGREIYDSSDRQECLAVARRITNADAESWHREWSALARQVQEQAAHPRVPEGPHVLRDLGHGLVGRPVRELDRDLVGQSHVRGKAHVRQPSVSRREFGA